MKNDRKGFKSVAEKVRQTKYNPNNDPYFKEFKKLLKEIFKR